MVCADRILLDGEFQSAKRVDFISMYFDPHAFFICRFHILPRLLDGEDTRFTEDICKIRVVFHLIQQIDHFIQESFAVGPFRDGVRPEECVAHRQREFFSYFPGNFQLL